MKQEFVEVFPTCGKTLNQKRDEKIREMNEKGFKLISLEKIPATHGEYATNEGLEMLFENENL